MHDEHDSHDGTVGAPDRALGVGKLIVLVILLRRSLRLQPGGFIDELSAAVSVGLGHLTMFAFLKPTGLHDPWLNLGCRGRIICIDPQHLIQIAFILNLHTRFSDARQPFFYR